MSLPWPTWTEAEWREKLGLPPFRANYSADQPRVPAGHPEGGRWTDGSDTGGIDSPAFKRWFGASKVVDADGNPLVVYHGTPSRGSESNNPDVRAEQADNRYPVIEEFDTETGGITDRGWLGRGTYFTSDPAYADEFGDRMMPVYLSIQRPFVVDDDRSMGFSNYFKFKQSVAHIEGMPEALAITTTLPGPRRVVDYRGQEFTVDYQAQRMADGTWGVIEHYSDHAPGTGIVEVSGRASRAEAIDAFAVKQKHFYVSNPDGFLLHTITRTIGPERFTELLQKAGYDGVHAPGVSDEWVAFRPEQIKSVWNRGTWSPTSKNISMSAQPRAAYSPDQPRVPAGSPEGGQWVSVLGHLSDRVRQNTRAWQEKTGHTREVMAARVRAIYQRATEEQRRAGAAWYPNARLAAARLAQQYGLTTDQAAGVIAALSPLREWSENLQDAQNVLRSVVRGEAVPDVQKLFSANVNKAVAIARGADPTEVLWQGRVGFKVRSFYMNIAHPERPEVTIDTHMLRIVLGNNAIASKEYNRYASAPGHYDAFRQAVLDVAAEVGQPPTAVQATVWLVQKAEQTRRTVGHRVKAAAAATAITDRELALLLDAVRVLFPEAATAIRDLYSADQPRVPAGSPEGGQWTDGAGLPAAVEAQLASWGRAFVREGFVGPLDEHGQDREVGITLGPDGRLIDTRTGTADAVDYSEAIGPAQTSMDDWPTGSTHVHGHPSSTAFSPADLLLALHQNATQGRLTLAHLVVLGKDGSEAQMHFQRVPTPNEVEILYGAAELGRMEVYGRAMRTVTQVVQAREHDPALTPLQVADLYTQDSLNRVMAFESRLPLHRMWQGLAERSDGLFTYEHHDVRREAPALTRR